MLEKKTLLANSISALREGLIQKTLTVNKKKDKTPIGKATALWHGI